jgi:hypothetical protein
MMTTSEKATQESTTGVHPIWYPHYVTKKVSIHLSSTFVRTGGQHRADPSVT